MRFRFGPPKRAAHTFLAIVACMPAVLAGCSDSSHPVRPYGAQGARLGESLALLGWNMSVSNLRWDGDYVLIDVDASPADPHAPHAKPEDIRFGLYGALAHPMESATIGSCDNAAGVRDIPHPLSASAEPWRWTSRSPPRPQPGRIRCGTI